MDYSHLIIILSLAFPIGMVHALDADHVAAVSGMVNHRNGILNSILFCLNWAIGHSVTLIVIGMLVFISSITIPASFSGYAEFMVGLMLILIGIGVARDIVKKDLHIHFHEHENKPRHAHWHSHQKDTKHEHGHHHRAVLIGVLHGAAGYAPLIAIIPVAASQSPWVAIAYLLVFGAGVFVAMLFVGGLLGVMFKRLNNRSGRLMNLFRSAISAVSIFIGSLLIVNVAMA